MIKSYTPFTTIAFVIFLQLAVGCTCIYGQSGLSIQKVIEKTVEHNPQIKVNLQNIEYSKGSFRVARSDFNTDLLFNVLNSKGLYPNALDDPTKVTESRYWSYTVGASRKFTFGTVVTPSFSVLNSNNALTNQGRAFISLEQPVLRGLGTGYNTANMRIAELNISSQEHRYLFSASQILSDALSAYVDYISAKLNLDVQQMTESSMSETVRQLKRLVELDAIPGSELIVSEANLSNQKTSTALAMNQLAYSKNQLATTMGMSLEEVDAMGDPMEYFPMTESAILVDDIYTEKWIEESMKQRHDYLASANDLKASEISLSFSQKGMLPKLNLTLGAGYNGLYQTGNFDQYYRPYFSNLPGMSYNVGVAFDIAPRYDLQKGKKVQAMAQNEAATSYLQYVRLQITRDVRKDCNQLQYFLGATRSVSEAVDFSARALSNEKTKLELGSSTAFNVALMQNSYLNALVRQISLFQQLNKAIIMFKYHTGTLVIATGGGNFTVNSQQLFVVPQAP